MTRHAIIAATLLLLVTRTLAATSDAQHGKTLFLKHCTSCHGRNAWGNGVKEIPSLAGQRENYLEAQLTQFITLERNSSAMHKATLPPDVSNAQAVRDLSAYLAHLPVNPAPVHAEGPPATGGEALFQRACAQCHGKSAQGSATEPIPALAGQHYPYLLVQLKNFAAGHRGQVEPPVIDFTAGLSAQEQKSVADYLSRLKSESSAREP